MAHWIRVSDTAERYPMAKANIAMSHTDTGWRVFVFLRRLPILPVLVLVTLVVAGVFAPLITRHDPTKNDLSSTMLPPAWLDGGSARHFLGTDHLGRDILTRVIHGARISLVVAVTSIAAGATLGALLGIIGGYRGGVVDEVIMRVADLQLAFPVILIALVLGVSVGINLLVLVGILVITMWSRYARVIRGDVLRLRESDYVSIAQVAGASTTRILLKHIFPGTINTIIVMATLQVGWVILTEATLSFLGVGVQPPTPAWGLMVSDGRARMLTGWWISLFPGLAILFTVLSFNLLGDWLRDYLDPRLRQLA
jgi:peptide/nickel transport system permease protein